MKHIELAILVNLLLLYAISDLNFDLSNKIKKVWNNIAFLYYYVKCYLIIKIRKI